MIQYILEWQSGWELGSGHTLFCLLSHVWLLVTLRTVVHQGPLSMGFFRQENWQGSLFPAPRDPPNPEIKPATLGSSSSLEPQWSSLNPASVN